MSIKKCFTLILAITRAALSTGGRAPRKSKFLSVAAKTLPLASGLAMAASSASAQSFTGLGFFTDPPVAGTESYARSVSDNGVVVGFGFIPPGNAPTTGFRAFGWTQAGGMANLGTLTGQPFSYGHDVSADGLKVVGFCSDGSVGPLPVSGSIVPSTALAFLWTPAGMVNLNSYLPTLGINLAGWTLREARDISADGTTISGWGWHNGSAEAWVARLVP